MGKIHGIANLRGEAFWNAVDQILDENETKMQELKIRREAKRAER